mmetsp:Transcript_6750/g.24968  ORF Transcript_6750/g.24968 Transcript_6750/m.24968 type:complete len:115 (-) Transcript_6750:2-346(-)|eukprot:scaffold2740_cov418-Prasinococcus_capsulatus_cf.AAC.31
MSYSGSTSSFSSCVKPSSLDGSYSGGIGMPSEILLSAAQVTLLVRRDRPLLAAGSEQATCVRFTPLCFLPPFEAAAPATDLSTVWLAQTTFMGGTAAIHQDADNRALLQRGTDR